MEDVSCIFCGMGSQPVHIEQDGYSGRRCPQCGLIYLSPRPSKEEIVDLYGHNLAHAGARAHIKAEYEKRLIAKHHLNLFKQHAPNGGKILEIGAGAGFFLDEARKKGFNSYALEINPIYTTYLKDVLNIEVDNQPLSAGVFPNLEFDVIYHCDVISHFYDPVSEFREMNKKLKKDGLLVFETGNFADVDEKYYPYYPSFQFPDHLYFFGYQNLLELLRRAGFEVVKVYRYAIIPQLRLLKMSSKFAGFLQKKDGQRNDEIRHKTNQEGKDNQNHLDAAGNTREPYRPRHFLNDGMGLLNYFVRYKLGALVVRMNQPQTVIIIAKKK